MQKPRIFISSTVYDFRDLRSALKYWLEQLGYEVLLSEFNDFQKPLDEDSLNACLQAVTSANYYILLIGSRVGGFYDSTSKISVTRKEYRTAYDLMMVGKMKLITFVREDLWVVKEDRAKLRDYLMNQNSLEKEIDAPDIAAISNHPSKFVNDAEIIFDFINEVSKEDELRKAVGGNGEFPKGNWIHTFSAFQDIVETLQVTFNMSISLSQIAIRENLKRELLSNIAIMVNKTSSNTIYPLADTWTYQTRKFVKGSADESSRIPSKYLNQLIIYLVLRGKVSHLSTLFLDHALSSGEFLEYDFETDQYTSGILNDALISLKERIEMVAGQPKSTPSPFDIIINKYMPLLKSGRDISVSNLDLLIPLAMANREDDILRLSIALVKTLNGDNEALQILQLNPFSPLPDESERVQQDKVTPKELIEWINSQHS